MSAATLARPAYRLTTLKDLAGDSGVFVDGDWIESKDQDPAGDVRLIQMMDIGDGDYLNKSKRFLTRRKAEDLRCTFLKQGDVLISRMPDPLGRSCIFPGDEKPCVTAVDVCILRPDPRLADARWVKYLVNEPTFRSSISRWTTGTTRERISRSNLAKIEFPLPPLAEQKRIADILDKADAIRRKRREAIAAASSLLVASFLDLFGDAISNPRSWPTSPIGDLASLVTSGLTPRGGSNVYADNGPYFIRSQNVLMNRLDLSDAACLPLDTHEAMRRTRVVVGDVLLNITGASIGRVTWVESLDREANVNQHVCIIRPIATMVAAPYLSVALSLPASQDRINRIQSGASRQGLNHQQVRSIVLPVPPRPLQSRFEEIVSQLQRSQLPFGSSREETEALFNSLVQRAFRGEL